MNFVVLRLNQFYCIIFCFYFIPQTNDDFEEEIYDEDRYDALNDETFGNDMSGNIVDSDKLYFCTYNVKYYILF